MIIIYLIPLNLPQIEYILDVYDKCETKKCMMLFHIIVRKCNTFCEENKLLSKKISNL